MPRARNSRRSANAEKVLGHSRRGRGRAARPRTGRRRDHRRASTPQRPATPRQPRTWSPRPRQGAPIHAQSNVEMLVTGTTARQHRRVQQARRTRCRCSRRHGRPGPDLAAGASARSWCPSRRWSVTFSASALPWAPSSRSSRRGISPACSGSPAPAPIISFLPVLLVGILFGLAMDYEVFLVSRMREDLSTAETPARRSVGFRHGGRVVTAAALIMIRVFGGFVLGGRPDHQVDRVLAGGRGADRCLLHPHDPRPGHPRPSSAAAPGPSPWLERHLPQPRHRRHRPRTPGRAPHDSTRIGLGDAAHPDRLTAGTSGHAPRRPSGQPAGQPTPSIAHPPHRRSQRSACATSVAGAERLWQAPRERPVVDPLEAVRQARDLDVGTRGGVLVFGRAPVTRWG